MATRAPTPCIKCLHAISLLPLIVWHHVVKEARRECNTVTTIWSPSTDRISLLDLVITVYHAPDLQKLTLLHNSLSYNSQKSRKTASSKRGTMPVNNNDRLLKLPAELRLQIYSYALLATEGVACQAVRMHGTPCFYRYTLYRTIGRRSRPSKDANAAGSRAAASKPIKAIPAVTHTREFNQLKHVCRDMYLDTKGLLVATNNLVFEYGIDKFLTFISTCPSSTLKTLRNVTIIDCRPPTSHVPGHKGDYAALFDFCKEYPMAEVQLRHDRLRPTSPNSGAD